MIYKICTDALGNLGSLACSKSNPFVDAVGLLLTTSDFSFATIADFANIAKWNTEIRAKRIFPLSGIIELEDQSEDSRYYESPSGVRIPRGMGKYRYMYMYNKPLEVHKALQSFRNANLKVFILDDAGNISGFSPNGVTVSGMTVQMFNPEKMKQSLQDNTPAWSPVVMDLQDAKEWNSSGIFITPGWNPLTLESVSDVELSIVGIPTATKITVKVAYYSGITPDGLEDLVGVAGIVQSDFVFTPTNTATMVDGGDGTYVFTGTLMVSGSVNLKTPALAVSLGAAIESTGSVVITI